MKLGLFLNILIICFIYFKGNTQVQCAVDVTINEGSSIEMCENALETINTSVGFVSYDWSGPEVLTGGSITPSFSGQYVVAATDGIGCVSNDTIDVIINPIPVDAIISSEGNTLCPEDAGTTLSVSGSYTLVNWGGGILTPTNFVTEPGVYSVSVADANSCVAIFDITIDQPVFDLQFLSGAPCLAQATTLIATGGSSYLWSTGETTPNIVVNPASTTVFSVSITEGSCTQLLDIPVSVGEVSSFELPDTLYMAEGGVQFVGGPVDYESYYWYPTNQIDDSTASGINFYGPLTQTITLEATLSGGCVVVDQVRIIVVRLTIPTGFSPNLDNINDAFVIPELDTLRGALTVWNRWGDVVYETKEYKNDWAGTCESDFCFGDGNLPEGTYFYSIDVFGILFKGYITIRK